VNLKLLSLRFCFRPHGDRLRESIGSATQPIQNVSDFNRSRQAFSQSSSRISAPRHVIEAECFDGHIWTPTVSSDGVAVMVSRLRQRALVTGQWMKAAA